MHGHFGIRGFVVRLFLCTVVVFVSYNPLEMSLYHWVTSDFYTDLVVKFLISVLMIIIYSFMVIVIYTTLEWIGVLIGSVMTAIVMHEVHAGGIDWTGREHLLVLTNQAVLAVALAVAFSTPHIVSRLSGQAQKRYLTKAKYAR